MTCFKKLLALSVSALLIGCSTTDVQPMVSAEQSMQLLQKAEVCCTSFGQLDYESIEQPGLYDFALTPDSQALELSTGKSFVQGVRLPSNAVEGIKVKVISTFNDSVYVPNVMLLDEHFNPVTTFGSEDIDYDSGSIFNGDQFEREIKISEAHLHSGRVEYLLVYTTKKDMEEVTILPKLDQGTIRVGRHNEPRMFDDVVIEHSALGSFQIKFSYSKLTEVKLASDNAPSIENAVVAAPVVLPLATKSEVSSPVDTIQLETEAMYIELVEKAVRENQIDKALRFVEEGEKAGSSKLRDVFFDALKQGR
ncbi:MalM family protein [Vibrio hannami]|uniref:MalM family protein n=1 Tax=Vibrio hannami TaxID=2717094 RepID=UPI00240F4CEA|nr:MalM family protein [Vibrio hannami]MDG3086044.1 MalM family protein [Vibrio hannami]